MSRTEFISSTTSEAGKRLKLSIDFDTSKMSEDELAYIAVRFENALQSLRTISELKDNWNDNGAKHFEKGLIFKCHIILKRLENYPPEVFPVADNSIQMEYDGDDGSYLQFRIYEDKVREFRVLSDGQKITKHIGKEKIPMEVKDFYERLYK